MPNRAKLLSAFLAALAAAFLAACSSGASSFAGAPAKPDPAVASARAALAAASASCIGSGGTWNGAGCVTPAAAVTTPTPATPTKVEFIVSGTAPDGIQITYGPSGSNYAGPSTLNGTVTRSVPFDGQASFYHLQAQLQGSGSIKCKIVVTGPGDEPTTVSSGGASGGFNICDAQAAPEDSSGVQWENED